MIQPEVIDVDAAAEPADMVLPNTMPHGRPRILVVDDQAVNVQALYRVFAEDHQVFVATSGEQALKICAEKAPDLVLLDIVMPGIDGYETCIRLKADVVTRDVPVIFVTGQNDEDAETRGLDVGAVDFITKPINPLVVRARVRTHVTLKRQSDQLRQIARVDGLTGVYNRRCFDDVLAREVRRSVRVGRPMALLMVDVDHFKRYNDCYGHPAGDACLQSVARALASTLTRPGDTVARYGGEEFACVLPETDHAGAIAVGVMLEERVRRMAMPHEDSPTSGIVTVSIGVASIDGLRPIAESALIEQADRQLYRAKELGRARVEGARAEVAGPLV